MELHFSELRDELIDFLNHHHTMVLATSLYDCVTARTISFINRGEVLYFQTDKRFEKARHINENSNVAVCKDNVQIEAKAFNQGHPFSGDNQDFIENYKKIHPGSFEKYSSSEYEIVIKVIPQKASIWKYIEEKPCRDFIDFNKKLAWREFYFI
jgi:general stress protein 26